MFVISLGYRYQGIGKGYLLDDFFDVLFSLIMLVYKHLFVDHIQQCYSAKRWPDLLKLMEHTVKAALKRDAESGKWKELQKQLHVVKRQVKYAESALAFSFVEVSLLLYLSLRIGCQHCFMNCDF